MRKRVSVGIGKGDHIYIPFSESGRSCLDGTLRIRTHRSIEEHSWYKARYADHAKLDHELVEYAPVINAEWALNGDGDLQCSNCGGGALIHPLTGDQYPTVFCPHCNAHMKQEV